MTSIRLIANFLLSTRRSATFGLAIFLTLTGSLDNPRSALHLVPEKVPIGETLAYHTEWGECAVAVYKLLDDGRVILAEIEASAEPYTDETKRTVEQQARRDLNYTCWHATPIDPPGMEFGFLTTVALRKSQYFDQIEALRETYATYALQSTGICSQSRLTPMLRCLFFPYKY